MDKDIKILLRNISFGIGAFLLLLVTGIITPDLENFSSVKPQKPSYSYTHSEWWQKKTYYDMVEAYLLAEVTGLNAKDLMLEVVFVKHAGNPESIDLILQAAKKNGWHKEARQKAIIKATKEGWGINRLPSNF